MTRLAVLDFGMGNLRSVAKALERVGASVDVIARSADVTPTALVVPGQGAFGSCLRRISARRGRKTSSAWIADGTAVPRDLSRLAGLVRVERGRGRAGPRDPRGQGRSLPGRSQDPAHRLERGRGPRARRRLFTGIEPGARFYFCPLLLSRRLAGRGLRDERLRRRLLLRGRGATTCTRSSSTPRRAASTASRCSRTSCGRFARRDPASRRRHPRRQMRATRAGRLRTRDRLRRGPGRGQAKRYESEGAAWLHVVDLDAALEGVPRNRNLIAEVIRSVRSRSSARGGSAMRRR